MNQLSCPYCHNVMSGQGINPGQTAVCPHCGRQFIRPGGAAPAARPAPARPAAARPAPVPVAASEPAVSIAQEYAEQRRAKQGLSVLWVILGIFGFLFLMVGLVILIFWSRASVQRSQVDEVLKPAAVNYVAENRDSAVEALNLPPGTSVHYRADDVQYGSGGRTATVRLRVTDGAKRNAVLLVDFQYADGRWEVVGGIRKE